MNYNKIVNDEEVSFGKIMPAPFLIGLLSAFDNRFQSCADSSMREITWKQFFAIICINLCKEPPAINRLSEIMGSSHQNVKQILLKLEKKGFVEFAADKTDKRKQLVKLTKKCVNFCKKNDEANKSAMNQIFHGISDEQIQTTINVISQMEKNLKKLQEI